MSRESQDLMSSIVAANRAQKRNGRDKLIAGLCLMMTPLFGFVVFKGLRERTASIETHGMVAVIDCDSISDSNSKPNVELKEVEYHGSKSSFGVENSRLVSVRADQSTGEKKEAIFMIPDGDVGKNIDQIRVKPEGLRKYFGDKRPNILGAAKTACGVYNQYDGGYKFEIITSKTPPSQQQEAGGIPYYFERNDG